MHILVIGGTRFVGPAVVTHLSKMGHEVTVFHRGRTETNLPPAVRHVHGNRKELSSFRAQFRHLAPDVVLDMFPFLEQDARAVMDALRGIVQRVVAISSQDVYRAWGKLHGLETGAIEPVPFAEDAPLRQALYPYRGKIKGLESYDKILVERVVMGDAQLSGTILRLPMLYGPRDPQHRLFVYLKRMDDKRPAILLEEGLADWRWSRGYVENVAWAIAQAVVDERAAGCIYNVAEPEALSMAEWIGAIGRVAGWKGGIVVVPRDCLPAHWRANINTKQHMVADTSRIRRELGYSELVPRDEALRRTIAWEREHPPAEIDNGLFDYATEDALLADLEQRKKEEHSGKD